MEGLARWTRRLIWLLPVYGLLTLLATLTHQPDPANRFEDWSRYVTTDVFLVSHLAGSIAGAGFGILGLTALAAALAGSRKAGLAGAGLVCAVFGTVFVTAVFGIAAGAQPALGRAFLEGTAEARALYDDVYGAPVLGLAVAGALLFSAGFVLLGWAAADSERLPKWAGVAVATGGPLIGLLGLVFGPSQTLGSLLVLAGGIALARTISGEVAGNL